MNLESEFVKLFCKYASISSASSPINFKQNPSTKCQFDMQNQLYEDLSEIGIRCEKTENCVLYAFFNEENTKERLVLTVHVDVSFDAPSAGINPQVHAYAGGDIQLAHARIPASDLDGVRVSSTVITSDGSTLLGGDDKAGVVIAVLLLKLLSAAKPPNCPSVCVVFTPDEEIGHGTDSVDLALVTNSCGSVQSLSLDGKRPKTVCFDTFTAWRWEVTLQSQGENGQSAAERLSSFVKLLDIRAPPPEESRLDGGYVWTSSVTADQYKGRAAGIVRSFYEHEAEALMEIVRSCAESFGGRAEFAFQYPNMRRFIPDGVIAKVTSTVAPHGAQVTKFRGGTDGSFLSAKGLPTPDIWDGAGNFHSVREFVVVDEALEALQVLFEIINVKHV